MTFCLFTSSYYDPTKYTSVLIGGGYRRTENIDISEINIILNLFNNVNLITYWNVCWQGGYNTKKIIKIFSNRWWKGRRIWKRGSIYPNKYLFSNIYDISHYNLHTLRFRHEKDMIKAENKICLFNICWLWIC